jgi:hypothetical protein
MQNVTVDPTVTCITTRHPTNHRRRRSRAHHALARCSVGRCIGPAPVPRTMAVTALTVGRRLGFPNKTLGAGWVVRTRPWELTWCGHFAGKKPIGSWAKSPHGLSNVASQRSSPRSHSAKDAAKRSNDADVDRPNCGEPVLVPRTPRLRG